MPIDSTSNGVTFPSIREEVVLSFALLVAGCASSTKDCATDCRDLGGGFGGVDIEVLEGECRADPRGVDCEADQFLQEDAVKCVAGETLGIDASDHDATLFYSYGYRTVLWSLVGEASPDCSLLLHATSGEFISSICGEPV